MEEALRATLADARIVLSLDGLVAYDTAAKPEAIAKLPFVTNSFAIIRRFEGANVAEMAAEVVADRAWNIEVKRGTFRVIASVANQLVALDPKVMEAIERRIAEKTGLSPNRSKPDHEFWLLSAAKAMDSSRCD